MQVIDDAWTTVESGRTTAVVGGLVPAPPEPSWHVIRIPCDQHREPGGAIAAATLALEALIRDSIFTRAKQRIGLSLRRRLLGDTEELRPIERFVETINRAALETPAPLALVFDGMRSADTESLSMLSELVGHPLRFNAALVLQFESMPSLESGPVADVLARVRSIEGPAGLVGTDLGPETWSELHPVLKATLSSTLR